MPSMKKSGASSFNYKLYIIILLFCLIFAFSSSTKQNPRRYIASRTGNICIILDDNNSHGYQGFEQSHWSRDRDRSSSRETFNVQTLQVESDNSEDGCGCSWLDCFFRKKRTNRV